MGLTYTQRKKIREMSPSNLLGFFGTFSHSSPQFKAFNSPCRPHRSIFFLLPQIQFLFLFFGVYSHSSLELQQGLVQLCCLLSLLPFFFFFPLASRSEYISPIGSRVQSNPEKQNILQTIIFLKKQQHGIFCLDIAHTLHSTFVKKNIFVVSTVPCQKPSIPFVGAAEGGRGTKSTSPPPPLSSPSSRAPYLKILWPQFFSLHTYRKSAILPWNASLCVFVSCSKYVLFKSKIRTNTSKLNRA